MPRVNECIRGHTYVYILSMYMCIIIQVLSVCRELQYCYYCCCTPPTSTAIVKETPSDVHNPPIDDGRVDSDRLSKKYRYGAQRNEK